MKNHEMPVRATYQTDAMRRVQDEDGVQRVVRLQETRAVSVTLVTDESKRVFWRGARIA